jgi:hypothetical protein
MGPGGHQEGEDRPLWAVTAYFNPFGERLRLDNFRRFRANLKAPLVAVELGYGRGFDLRDGDADILIQRRGGDVLWQKERLLNIGIAAVPRKCTKVAWIDADVIIAEEGWPEAASALLDRFPVIQPFGQVLHLARGNEGVDPELSKIRRPSFCAGLAEGQEALAMLDASLVKPGPHHAGFAWAARREIVARSGLYDRCILGGGDRAFVAACFGLFDHPGRYAYWNERQSAHYLPWAERIEGAVGASLGYLDADLFHMWHGELDRRLYRPRHEGLAKFRFDPVADIALADSGAWRWSSEKPEMHRYVSDYFLSRQTETATAWGPL